MKKYFFTGLIVILPFFLTIYIIMLVFKFVGRFFTPVLTSMLNSFPISQFRLPPSIIIIISAVVTLFLIWFVGVLASNLVGKKIFRLAEKLFLKIPMARGIYDSIRKLTDVFFSDKSNFKRVVAIEWPRKGVYVIAFVTSDEDLIIPGDLEEKVSVFMPTTPNFTTGFLMIVPKSQVISLTLPVDDAIKFILSGGIVVAPQHTSDPGITGTD